jgi:hypothetical protein
MTFGVNWVRGWISSVVVLAATSSFAEKPGAVGHWKLRGNAQDSSGNGHHAVNNKVDLRAGAFDGREAFLEVPDSPELNFGNDEFSISLQVSTRRPFNDVIGDLVSKFDAAQRKGFVLTFKSNSSGYNSQSDQRHLYFGADDGTTGVWTDCGRPGGVSHCSDALTIFNGDLYAGIVDAPDEDDWAHVYRYRDGKTWEDCGRVGSGRTRGVYAMIVHEDALYAATAGSHGGGKQNQGDFAKVYRYRGGKEWEDLGQPGEFRRINSLASFRGKLYCCAINTGRGSGGGIYVYDGDSRWKAVGSFPDRPHTMAVHDDRLYAAYPRGEVFVFDGDFWKSLGNPYGTLEECNQLHTMGVYLGELYVGTWPKARVAILRDGGWVDTGRMGDSTEVVGLVVYNGSLYGGAIPRAELFRFDGPEKWTSLRRLFDPPTYNPASDVEDWSRASSLTVYRDKLFVSTATCYRAMLSSPQMDEIRGKVYSFQTGAGVSHDHNLGDGWKHVAAVRDKESMKLYVDGRLVASQPSAPGIDVSNTAPLRIGFGPQSHLQGQLRDVQLFRRALGTSEVQSLADATGAN